MNILYITAWSVGPILTIFDLNIRFLPHRPQFCPNFLCLKFKDSFCQLKDLQPWVCLVIAKIETLVSGQQISNVGIAVGHQMAFFSIGRSLLQARPANCIAYCKGGNEHLIMTKIVQIRHRYPKLKFCLWIWNVVS